MASTKETIQPGKLIPNWTVKDTAGQKQVLWDYRQKSHLVFINAAEIDAKTVERWLSAILADQRQWDWLNVKFVISRESPKEAAPGAYLIDRYGILLTTYAAGNWNFDDIEREFLYYEAKHC